MTICRVTLVVSGNTEVNPGQTDSMACGQWALQPAQGTFPWKDPYLVSLKWAQKSI